MTDCGEHARCILALEDGTIFFGECFGAEGTQTGKVVFNTSMTGYEEVLTDPSYCGQIITMTSPQIGNYGITTEDVESSRPHVAGFIVKELARRHSNYRATLSLDEYLAQHNVIGLPPMISRSTAKGWCVVPRPKSQIISALFFTTYDFAVLKMGPESTTHARRRRTSRISWSRRRR